MNQPNPSAVQLTKDAVWNALLDRARHGPKPRLEGPIGSEAAQMRELFEPLLGPLPADRPLVVGHLAQSLDGCIAREDGESHWISGEADLEHTHRLRAFCDAVLVGSATVDQDDCKLTVRRCAGDHPLRIVLDPNGSVSPERALMNVSEVPTLWVVGEGVPRQPAVSGVERLVVPAPEGQFLLSVLLSQLKARGVDRLFVEGGGYTITRFLAAQLIDRLHLAMSPVLMGTGRRSITDVLGDSLGTCPRPVVSVHPMGIDWLFDCDFGHL
jgi:diaminohydroxyphosphoribosylaminopyrimidine deaminase / 5-amino-6-(5-phosphoribosylamino)uracil reductase